MTSLARIVCGLFLLTLPWQAGATPLDDAIALYDAHNVTDARDQLAKIADSEPKNLRALKYLGLAEMKLLHREAAVDVFKRAAELAPKDAEIVANYGNACLLRASELGVSFTAIGLARRGRDALEQCVILEPAKIGYREGLVQFYTRAPGVAGGSFARAYAHIDEITKLNPDRGLVIKANALCSEKRYAEATSACETALLKNPDSYLALYTLGRITSETGKDIPRAEASLRRCLELTPRPEEPDHAGARYRLGMIAELDKRPADARREYQAALALEPTLQKASEALARLK